MNFLIENFHMNKFFECEKNSSTGCLASFFTYVSCCMNEHSTLCCMPSMCKCVLRLEAKRNFPLVDRKKCSDDVVVYCCRCRRCPSVVFSGLMQVRAAMHTSVCWIHHAATIEWTCANTCIAHTVADFQRTHASNQTSKRFIIIIIIIYCHLRSHCPAANFEWKSKSVSRAASPIVWRTANGAHAENFSLALAHLVVGYLT